VRTTLTLDDDVAVKLKAAAKSRSFRAVVNEALRAGLAALEKKRVPPRKPYRTRGFDLGPSLVGSLDNVEEVLSRVEGEPHL
jgi:plasmid stability protein